jgi:hypothetical protein
VSHVTAPWGAASQAQAMKLANSGRTDRKGAPSLEPEPGSGDSAGTWLDEATRARVQLVCGFVNAEIARWRNQVIGVAVACFAGMFLLFTLAGIVDALIVVVIAIGFLGFWIARARRELAEGYARLATKRLVAAVSKELTYKATSSLTREQFDSLDLLPVSGKGWQARYEIAGHAGDATFSLHAVHSPSAEREHKGFDGLLVRVSVASPFAGHTVVLPERAESSDTARAAAKRDLVLVKHSQFERMFSAYSTDYTAAKRTLTDGLLRIIVSAASTIGPDIRMAFVKRSLFVSVPNARLLPEVTLLSAPLTPEQAGGQIARYVAFAVALATELTTGNGEQSLTLLN